MPFANDDWVSQSDAPAYRYDEDKIIQEEITESGENAPYIRKTLLIQRNTMEWNRDFKQDALCSCGHAYGRHFDGYENNSPVGCKYCGCYTFKLPEVNIPSTPGATDESSPRI